MFDQTELITATPDTLNFSLDQFDPSQGTLTGVTIMLTSNIEADFEATNNSANDGSFNGSFSLDIDLTSPLVLVNALPSISPGGLFGPTPILSGETIPFTEMANASTSTGVDMSDFGDFTGLGTVSFSADIASLLSSANANVTPFLFSSLGLSSGDVTVKITYDFEPDVVPGVPEPMSLYLMSGGLLGLGLLRFRRKNS